MVMIVKHRGVSSVITGTLVILIIAAFATLIIFSSYVQTRRRLSLLSYASDKSHEKLVLSLKSDTVLSIYNSWGKSSKVISVQFVNSFGDSVFFQSVSAIVPPHTTIDIQIPNITTYTSNYGTIYIYVSTELGNTFALVAS